jgi:hypothetical protein
MQNGLVEASYEGTPQGGPLSPLLSNVVLDELDKELERRGHQFVHYADDCNIYTASERAGHRVMASISAFITRRLKLKVNVEKSAVGRPWERKFLGFRISADSPPLRAIAPKAIARFKHQVRQITRRARGVSIDRVVKDLRPYFCADGVNILAGVKRHRCSATLINGSATGCAVTFGFNGARRADDGLASEGWALSLGWPRISHGLAALGGQAVRKL